MLCLLKNIFLIFCSEKKLPALISKDIKVHFIDPVKAGCDKDGFRKVCHV